MPESVGPDNGDKARPGPKCPGCRKPATQVSWNGVPQGPNNLVFFVFYHPDCQTVLGCQLLPMAAAAQVPPRIIVPGASRAWGA